MRRRILAKFSQIKFHKDCVNDRPVSKSQRRDRLYEAHSALFRRLGVHGPKTANIKKCIHNKYKSYDKYVSSKK
jgi:hypothetical protein